MAKLLSSQQMEDRSASNSALAERRTCPRADRPGPGRSPFFLLRRYRFSPCPAREEEAAIPTHQAQPKVALFDNICPICKFGFTSILRDAGLTSSTRARTALVRYVPVDDNAIKRNQAQHLEMLTTVLDWVAGDHDAIVKANPGDAK